MIKLKFKKYIIFSVLILTSLFPLIIFAKSENAGSSDRGISGEHKQENATVGNVEKVTPNSIVVEDKRKQKLEAVFDKNTKVIGKDMKNIKINQIKPNDKAAIISSDSTKVKRALKVFVKDATSSAQSKRRAVQGVILNIQGQVITLAHQIHRERTYQVIVDNKTIITSKESTASASLTVGLRIAVVGDLNQNGQIVAKRIHIIPGKAIGIFRRLPVATASSTPTATPSGSPSASPSATPTLSPTPSPSPSL